MTPSVSPEADWELSEGAIFYAREANAKVGLAEPPGSGLANCINVQVV